jgi:transcriptional regulator with XRE-family HTH domain
LPVPDQSSRRPIVRRSDELAHRPAWARNLYLARIERGWLIADLVEATGIHDSVLSRYETGNRRPTPEAERRILAALAKVEA